MTFVCVCFYVRMQVCAGCEYACVDEGTSKVSMCMTYIYHHVPALASSACACTFISSVKIVFLLRDLFAFFRVMCTFLFMFIFRYYYLGF